MKKQSGVSLTGFLMLACLIGFVAITVMKLTPAYIEFKSIKQAMDAAAGSNDDSVSKVREELKKIQRELGISFIHVTHGQDEALALADEIVLMNNAVIEQSGSARDVFNAPRSEFVARFLGGHNVVSLEGKRYALRSDRTRLVTPGDEGLDVSVTSHEFLGTHVAVNVIGPGDVELTAMVPEEQFYAAPVEPGDSVRIGWTAQDLHLLAG